MTSSGFSSCDRMAFARTLPSSTPIWSVSRHQLKPPPHRQTEVTHTEGVDAPNNTLREDLVLVQRNEGPKRRGRQEREDDAVARAVALEDLRLDERVRRIGPELLAHLLLGLAERERLGLREEVGEEDAVVLRVRDRVVRSGGREEVRGDELRALVHELVERVLAVGAGCTPDDRL